MFSIMKKLYFSKVCLMTLFLIFTSCGNNEGDPNPVDCTSSPIVFTVDLTEEECGLKDGIIEVIASGGQGNLSYSKDGGENFQVSPIFDNLTSGTYTIVVRDANECESSSDVFLQNTGGLTISIDSQTDATCEANVGEIVANSAGGSGNVQFRLEDGSLQASGIFSGLAPGKYTVQAVEDGTGCETGISVTIFSGVSFSASIQNIITTKCAISGCHNGDNGANRNWTVFSNVQRNAANIKSRTSSGSMPPSNSAAGGLSQTQIDLIACWVDDGAKDN